MTISQNPTFDTFQGLFNEAEFVYRHLGSNETKQADLLSAVGYQDMASFINDTVPEPVRLHKELDLPVAMSEHAALAKLRTMADDITVKKSYIGQGYSPVRMPAVIQRNVLENPGWYTAYTPACLLSFSVTSLKIQAGTRLIPLIKLKSHKAV